MVLAFLTVIKLIVCELCMCNVRRMHSLTGYCRAYGWYEKLEFKGVGHSYMEEMELYASAYIACVGFMDVDICRTSIDI
jgi:hypothetical protein